MLTDHGGIPKVFVVGRSVGGQQCGVVVIHRILQCHEIIFEIRRRGLVDVRTVHWRGGGGGGGRWGIGPPTISIVTKYHTRN